MNQVTKKNESEKGSHRKRNLVAVFLKMGGLTVLLALLIYLIGYFLDRFFQTRPLIAFGLLAFSAPLVVWLNTIIIRRELGKASTKSDNLN